VGVEVIGSVPTVLHTPLMSGANAIHGVVIVGAIYVMLNVDTENILALILGFLAVLLGTLNVVGGVGVTGNIYSNAYSYSLGFFGLSDYRIKDTVIELDDSYSVDKLRPVSYYNKLTKNVEMGFIAHEVQEVYPHLVHGPKDGEGYQSVNYPGIISLLVNDIQWLRKELNALKGVSVSSEPSSQPSVPFPSVPLPEPFVVDDDDESPM